MINLAISNIFTKKTIINTLSIMVLLSLLSACGTNSTHRHSSLAKEQSWSYGIDPYGSTVKIGKHLIESDVVSIEFNRAPKPAADRNTWIELIYHAPQEDLLKTKKMRITYQCNEPLLIKFSQKDYGAEGDNSYAHYQTLLPAANDWQTLEVSLSDFARPLWTPAESTNVGLIMSNVSAIYLAPSLDDSKGGYAKLKVKGIDLLTE